MRKSKLIQVLAANWLIQACTIAQTVLVSRILGPTGRGEFAGMTLWAAFFAAVGQGGITNPLSISATKEEGDYDLLNAGIIAAATTGIISSIICFLVLVHAEEINQNSTLLFIVSMQALVTQLTTAIVAVVHGRADYDNFNIIRIAQYPAFLISTAILFLIEKDSVQAITFLYCTSNTMTLAIAIVKSKCKFIPSEYGKALIIIKKGLPFWGNEILNAPLQHLDKLLLLSVLGAKDLGIYMAAHTAAGSLAVITSAISILALPKTSTAVGESQSYASYGDAVRKNILLGGFAAITLVAAMQILIPLIFGKAFEPAVQPAMILTLGYLLQSINLLTEQTLRMQNRPYISIPAKIIASLTFFTFSLIFIKISPSHAIVISWVIAQALATVYLLYTVALHYPTANLRELFPKSKDIKLLFKQD